MDSPLRAVPEVSLLFAQVAARDLASWQADCTDAAACPDNGDGVESLLVAADSRVLAGKTGRGHRSPG